MNPFRIAIVLAIVCMVAAWQVRLIPASLMQMTVGPTLVPTLIVSGLSLLTLLYGFSAWRGRQADESLDQEHSPLPAANHRFFALLAGGLMFVVLVAPLGFIVPSTLCGLSVARAFDAPLNLKSFCMCATIASVAWVLFAQILGVGLGPGLPWWF